MQDVTTLKPDERLALDLMAAIRADAEAICAPNPVEMVSVTIDGFCQSRSGPVAAFADAFPYTQTYPDGEFL
mgnify:CR=1 FL=1